MVGWLLKKTGNTLAQMAKKTTKDRQDNRSPRQDLNNGPLESKEGM
jgi:hypothetical protein